MNNLEENINELALNVDSQESSVNDTETEETKKKDIKSKLIDTAAIVLIPLAGGGVACCKLQGDLKNLNLGQISKYQNVPKYKVTNGETGKPTGKGFAFEDRIMQKLKSLNINYSQVEENKYQPDFVVDGIKVQAKCYKSANHAFSKLFKDGKYKYPGQEIWTNTEIAEELQQIIDEHPDMFDGERPIIRDTGISIDEAEDACFRGVKSLKIDASDVVKDKNFWVTVCSIVALIVTAEFVYDYNKEANEPMQGEKSHTSFLSKVKRTIKAHWVKYSATSALVIIGVFAIHLGSRQMLRPSRVQKEN